MTAVAFLPDPDQPDLTAHERKSGGSHGDAVRGPGVIAGAVDIAISLGRSNLGLNVRTWRRSRFSGTPAELLVELDYDSYRVLGDATVARDCAEAAGINRESELVRRLATFHLKLAAREAALTGRSAAGIAFGFPRAPDPRRLLWPGMPAPAPTVNDKEPYGREAAASAASSDACFRSNITRGRNAAGARARRTRVGPRRGAMEGHPCRDRQVRARRPRRGDGVTDWLLSEDVAAELGFPARPSRSGLPAA